MRRLNGRFLCTECRGTEHLRVLGVEQSLDKSYGSVQGFFEEFWKASGEAKICVVIALDGAPYGDLE